MGSLSFFDSIFNICRSFSDLLHILVYVFFAFIAVLFAWKKTDKGSFKRLVYEPLQYKIAVFIMRRTPFSYYVNRFCGNTRKGVELRSNRRFYRNRKDR